MEILNVTLTGMMNELRGMGSRFGIDLNTACGLPEDVAPYPVCDISLTLTDPEDGSVTLRQLSQRNGMDAMEQLSMAGEGTSLEGAVHFR